MGTWLQLPAKTINVDLAIQARQHQLTLTKPAGSLGQLEELAIQLAAMQNKLSPNIRHITIRIFAADHGVATEGVSAFPQAVTVEMIRNFVHGGAAISQLAEELEADFAVVNLGTANSAPTHAKVLNYIVGPGTKNFCVEPAMSSEQLAQALKAGQTIAAEAMANGADIFIGGEMGIGNTTTAAALACAVLREPASALVGSGTGVDNEGLARKIAAVRRALEKHQALLAEPISILECLGGFEIAALVGAYTHCAQLGLAVLVDGFICTVAALLAVKINPGVRDWLIFSHQSAEQGHQKVLQALNAHPLLSLGMRLGEGSGAAVAAPLLRMACRLHNQMATFENAGVSDRSHGASK